MENVIMNKLKKLSVLIPILLFSFSTGTCLIDDPLKMPFQNFVPPNLSDGWTIAAPEDVDIDGEALKDVYRYVHIDYNIWQIRSLLVIRDNKLVAESYMKDNDDRTNPRAVWSCTKQILGILTGIAVDKGLISITDTISDYLQLSPSQQASKGHITIENLLTMKSGINYSNGGYSGDNDLLMRGVPSSMINHILDLGMRTTPGTQFVYKDGDPHIISAILEEKIGKTTRDWAKEVLFDKIGITRLQWLTYKDGATFGGWGIYTTPRELGKIGQLVLDEGMWGNQRIVSTAWINEMTSSKVPSSEIDGGDDTFGYLWWKNTAYNVAFMAGHGGQRVFINKDKNLIVVITSEHDIDGDLEADEELSTIALRINNITR